MGQLVGIFAALLVVAALVRLLMAKVWLSAPQTFRQSASYLIAGGGGGVLYAFGSANGGPIYWEDGLPYFVVGTGMAICAFMASLGYGSSPIHETHPSGATSVGTSADALAQTPDGGDLLRRVRTALIVHGHSAENISEALVSFQIAKGLPVTQKVDPATLKALGIAL